jgi:Spy/CpxP family protein refolding chaperone
MSDTTATPSSPAGDATPRRRFLRRTAIAGVIAAGVSALGLTAFTHAGAHGWHRGGFMGGASLDPAQLDERLDRMLKHFYVEIDATDAQKQRLAPLVQDAARELLPLRGRLHEARRQALELLARETVDRGALETLRAEQLALAEQASRRLVQAVADIADVLTPEQRRQLADRIARRRGHRG